MCTSGSSSFSSTLSLSNTKPHASHNTFSNLINSSHLLASLSVTSLANVSIFENEEYFNYFHKLLQQFNFIDFNLKVLSENVKPQQSPPAHLIIPNAPPTPPPTGPKPHVSSRMKSSSNRRGSNTPQPFTNAHHALPSSPSTPIASVHNHNGVLKSISKRFNIKSWFSSNNGTQSSSAVGQKQQQPQQPNVLSSQSYVSQTSATSFNKPVNFKNAIQSTPPTSRHDMQPPNYTTPTATCCYNQSLVKKLTQHHSHSTSASNNLMKHSLSEPSLNAIMN